MNRLLIAAIFVLGYANASFGQSSSAAKRANDHFELIEKTEKIVFNKSKDLKQKGGIMTGEELAEFLCQLSGAATDEKTACAKGSISVSPYEVVVNVCSSKTWFPIEIDGKNLDSKTCFNLAPYLMVNDEHLKDHLANQKDKPRKEVFELLATMEKTGRSFGAPPHYPIGGPWGMPPYPGTLLQMQITQ